MTALPPDLDPERLGTLLRTKRYGRSLSVLASTGSTNDDARRALAEGAADGHVIVADMQVQGRGSHGRQWSSPAGSDLYLSIVARIPLPLAELPPLTLALGLAVAETVEQVLGAPAQVKWPNDVWVQRRKIAGILVESVSSSCSRADPRASGLSSRADPRASRLSSRADPRASTGSDIAGLVLGVGLNVRRREFAPWIDTAPTSLALEGAEADRGVVLATLLQAIENWVDRFIAAGPAPVAQAVEQRLALRGERAACDGLEGIVEGVSPNGALRVRVGGAVHELYAGTLRPLSS